MRTLSDDDINHLRNARAALVMLRGVLRELLPNPQGQEQLALDLVESAEVRLRRVVPPKVPDEVWRLAE